jgi:hypothetical protein
VEAADTVPGHNPHRASQCENNVQGKDGPDACSKGSDHLPDSPPKKRMRKEKASCSASKSGDTTGNEGASMRSQQKCRIPSTKGTPNENGEVINGLDNDDMRQRRKEDKMPCSGSNATARSVDDIPCNVIISCPDSDFYDFEKNKCRFRADQIWAVYDKHDGMPRYYARIKQVYSPNFMLRFTWLELDPLNDAEKAWSSKELPVACGNFRVGKRLLTEDIKMFSHVVSWIKGRKRCSYEIYPRKGELWALYKGWGMVWCSDTKDHRPYNYDVVEITSDYARGTGTCVIPLVKVKGFVSTFVQPNKQGPYLIPDGDTPRFSHSIPFHRLSETYSQHIPNGALELDPAALPSDLEKAFTSVDLDSRSSCHGEMTVRTSKQSQDVTALHVQDGVMKPTTNRQSKQDKGSEASLGCCNNGLNDSSEPESPTSFDYPDAVFCNLTDLKSFDKFKKGQIWAMYCDTDKFPKYYGFIKSVSPDNCSIHIKWLEHCPCEGIDKCLAQDRLPVGRGTFRVSRQTESYNCTSFFSHMMAVTGKGKKYEILPRVAQVWAIYKNWKRGWSIEDYKRCA